MSEFTDDEVVGTTLIENEPGSVVPVVEVKHPGSWREQRDKVFKRARYPKEMKEKILVRMGELFEQGNLKTDILRIMKEEGFKKADGTEIDAAWLDYFRYNNRIAKYPTRGEVAKSHLKSKMQDVVDQLREEEEAKKQNEDLSPPSTHGLTRAILSDDSINEAKKVRLLKVLWCEV